MKLIDRFHEEMNRLEIASDSKLLVAVSGGIDSMVLLHLVQNNWSNVAAAHVNYELRGSESEGDQAFVKKYCKTHGIKLYHTRRPIDTENEQGSIQELARKKRYDWFEELRLAHGYDYILTAHHAQDRLETFFMNLTRGAGVQGLKAIPSKYKHIIRPVLKAMKEEIADYAKDHHLGWRVDSSNAKLDYMRNRVRHSLVDAFAGLSETANIQASKSLDYLSEANEYFMRTSIRMIENYQRKGTFIFISDEEWQFLFDNPPLHKYVFDALGFNPGYLDQLEILLKKQSGRLVETQNVEAYRDRGGVLIDQYPNWEFSPVEINTPEGEWTENVHFTWKGATEDEVQKNTKTRISIDVDKLQLPLTLRLWKPGDRIYPKGLKGSKKLSDLLTDLKFSVPEKNRTLVLASGDDIVWVLGVRTDVRFEVTDSSKNICIFELHD